MSNVSSLVQPEVRQFTADQLRTTFENMLPQLEGRIRGYCRRISELNPAEMCAEMIAMAWKNFVSKANRCGTLLPPSQLAFMAFMWVRNGRRITGYTSKDALGEETNRLGRTNVYYLSQVSHPTRRHELSKGTANRITLALSSSERESPAVLAAVRLDWRAFLKTLDKRFKIIVHALSIGESKSNIAKQICVSPGRVTQILEILAFKIRVFFGASLPDWCW